MSFEIVKAGWLFRQSTVLKRWKKNWFVLYKDSVLKWFESPNSHVAEDTMRMQVDCLSIQSGLEVTNVATPEGFGQSSLLKLLGRDDKLLVLCAESPDDMSAWKYALEQSRLISAAPAAAPPPYTDAMVQPQGASYPSAAPYPQQQTAYAYPGQVYYGTHPPGYVVQAPPGQTTVIYQQDPYYRRRGIDGGDVAMGMVAGAALGTMMWGPMLWW